MPNIHYTLWKIFQWDEFGLEQWKFPVLPSKQPCPSFNASEVGHSLRQFKSKENLRGDKEGQLDT